MAIAHPPSVPPPSRPGLLTWEQYQSEGEVSGRYDIIDGERIFMPGPVWRHQRISKNLTGLLTRYEETSGHGQVVSAPFDVVIRRVPLHTRQPDVLFISQERWQEAGGADMMGALEVAPELVIEILSPSETLQQRESKIADYSAIGVQECWVVNMDLQTVEMMRLTLEGAETLATYGMGETVQSQVFPDLTIAVTDIFAA